MAQEKRVKLAQWGAAQAIRIPKELEFPSLGYVFLRKDRAGNIIISGDSPADVLYREIDALPATAVARLVAGAAKW